MMKQKFSQETGLIKSTPLYLLTCAVLLVVLAVSVLSAVTFGTVKIPVSQVYRVILHELFGVGSSELGSGSIHDVVWLIRLPRLILAVAVGMGLSVCGVVMQAIVKNPLADPYILGVSSGASLGATVAIMLGVGAFLGAGSIGICAFAGAFGISLAGAAFVQYRRALQLHQAVAGRHGAQFRLLRLFQLCGLFCQR